MALNEPIDSGESRAQWGREFDACITVAVIAMCWHFIPASAVLFSSIACWMPRWP